MKVGQILTLRGKRVVKMLVQEKTRMGHLLEIELHIRSLKMEGGGKTERSPQSKKKRGNFV